MNRSQLGKFLQILIGILFTVVFLYITLKGFSWDVCQRALVHTNYIMIILGLLMLFIDYSFRILRWWVILRTDNRDLYYSQCIGPYLASIALNNVLPFRVGDVIRVVGFKKNLNITAMPILASMIVERLLDIFVLLLILFITYNYVRVDVIHKEFITTSYLFMSLCLLIILLILLIPKRLVKIISSLKARFEEDHQVFISIINSLERLVNALVQVSSDGLMLKLFVLSLGVWIFEGAMFLAVAKALSINGAWFGPWFALAIGTLATVIPSTPGYIGTFDFFTMKGMMAYGISKDVSTLFAILVHITLWVPLTIIGVLWIWFSLGSSMRKLIIKSNN